MNETAAIPEQEKKERTGAGYYLHLALSLLAVTAIVALLLGLVNSVTEGPIADLQEQERQDALAAVAPGADVFSELYSADPTIERITGAYAGTELKAYCVEVSPNGFGGPVSMMVGVSPSGAVTGVVILDHSETAGLGANAERAEFRDQFVGKSGTITVKTGDNSIDALTGATITSKAVTSGVNTALTAVLNFDPEGGMNLEDSGV